MTKRTTKKLHTKRKQQPIVIAIIVLLIAGLGVYLLRGGHAAPSPSGGTFKMIPPANTNIQAGNDFDVDLRVNLTSPASVVLYCVTWSPSTAMDLVSLDTSVSAFPNPFTAPSCATGAKFAGYDTHEHTGDLDLGRAKFHMKDSSGAVTLTYTAVTEADGGASGASVGASLTGTSVTATAAPVKPTSPNPVTTTATAYNSVNISWHVSTPQTAGATINHYTVSRNGWSGSKTVNAPALTLTDTDNVAGSTTYSYSVTATDSNGQTSDSATGQVTTPKAPDAGCTSNCNPSPTGSNNATTKSNGTTKHTTSPPVIGSPTTNPTDTTATNDTTLTSQTDAKTTHAVTSPTKKRLSRGEALAVVSSLLLIGGGIIGYLLLLKRRHQAVTFGASGSAATFGSGSDDPDINSGTADETAMPDTALATPPEDENSTTDSGVIEPTTVEPNEEIVNDDEDNSAL